MKEIYRIELAGFPIVLEQRSANSFRVTYGRQVGNVVSYDRAATELGCAIMHALACEGRIDTPSETH